MKSKENLTGAWAVLIGVVIAIIFGIFQETILVSYTSWIYVLLASLGVIIGFVSVSSDSKDSVTFLLATVSLVIVCSIGQEKLALIGTFGLFMGTIFNTLLIMFIPATIVVALKTVFSVANVE